MMGGAMLWDVVALDTASLTQIIAAGATLVLAGVTAWMAYKTSQVAKQTQNQATATTKAAQAAHNEAEATKALAAAAQIDRLLQWRPQLELRDLYHAENGWKMRIRNTGSGPALDVVVAAREMSNIGNWCLLRVGDLRPGDDSETEGFNWSHGGALTSIFEGFFDLDERRVATSVMLCSDVLGRRFRFGIADPKDPYPGEISKVLGAEISPALSPAHPFHEGWANEPLIWG
jgi:hypothetical protein